MRTKEKFYENLNKKHVSIEKRVERFEFRDVKTLDAMVKEANKIQDAGLKAGDNFDDASNNRVDWQQKQQKLLKKKAIRETFLIKQKKVALKMVQDAEKEVTKAATENNDAIEKFNKAVDIEKKFLNAYNTVLKRAENHKSEMKSAISQFQSSAKALGVDVSSKVAKYNAAASDVDSF